MEGEARGRDAKYFPEEVRLWKVAREGRPGHFRKRSNGSKGWSARESPVHRLFTKFMLERRGLRSDVNLPPGLPLLGGYGSLPVGQADHSQPSGWRRAPSCRRDPGLRGAGSIHREGTFACWRRKHLCRVLHTRSPRSASPPGISVQTLSSVQTPWG